MNSMHLLMKTKKMSYGRSMLDHLKMIVIDRSFKKLDRHSLNFAQIRSELELEKYNLKCQNLDACCIFLRYCLFPNYSPTNFDI